MSQCKGETKSGERCQRQAGDSDYCYLHSHKSQQAQARERATKFDDIRRQKILNSIRKGGPLRKAAEAAGIDGKTLRNWRNKFPDFDEDVRRAQAETADELTGAIKQQALKGDWRAAKWLLEVWYPEIRQDHDADYSDIAEELEDPEDVEDPDKVQAALDHIAGAKSA